MHLNEDTFGLFEPTQEGATKFGDAVKSALSGMAPIVQVTTGFLNKYNYVYIKVILQAKEKWPNGIINNASQFTMHLTADGTMEMTTSHLYVKSKRPHYALDRLPIKFRKSKVKNSADAIGKIKKLINDIRSAFEAEGVSLEGTGTQTENRMKLSVGSETVVEKSGLRKLIEEIMRESLDDLSVKSPDITKKTIFKTDFFEKLKDVVFTEYTSDSSRKESDIKRIFSYYKIPYSQKTVKDLIYKEYKSRGGYNDYEKMTDWIFN